LTEVIATMMKRRDFATAAAAAAATALTAGLPGRALAQQRTPEDGVEYLTLAKRVNVDAPAGKVEVVDFFWYSCPHCNAFEPRLQAWIDRQPADVVVKRVPVAFRDDFVPQQRLFYTLEAMGKLGELHAQVFRSIHGDHEPVTRGDTILDWAGRHGLDRAKFTDIYNSFAVSSKARRATQIQDQYKINGVPSMGVAGRWYTDGDLARDMDRALQVTDWLVDQARKSR